MAVIPPELLEEAFAAYGGTRSNRPDAARFIAALKVAYERGRADALDQLERGEPLPKAERV